MSGREIKKEDVRSFAYDMGRIIGSINSALSVTSDFMVSDINIDGITIMSQDFNTNRCKTHRNEAYKLIRLFLLHLLSNIGFVLHILKKAIIRESGMLLRIEYITYHYALIRLDGIMRYCNSNADKLNDPVLLKMLNNIDYSYGNGLRKSEFRNCMMHFGLFDKNNDSLIYESKFDLSIPFCGLVGSLFSMSYDEYKCKIEGELTLIYTKLKDYMGFDLLLNDEQQ